MCISNTDSPTPTAPYPEYQGYHPLEISSITFRHSSSFKIYSEGLDPWYYPGIDEDVRLRYPGGWKYYEGDNMTEEKAEMDQSLIPKTTSTPNNDKSITPTFAQKTATDANIGENGISKTGSIPENNGSIHPRAAQETTKDASMAEFFQLSSDEMLASIAEKNKKVQILMAELNRKNQEIKHCMAVHKLKLENMAFKG